MVLPFLLRVQTLMDEKGRRKIMGNKTSVKLQKPPAYRWCALFLYVLSFCHFYIALQSVNALSASIFDEFNLSIMQFSLLTTASMSALLIFPYVGAKISNRYGAKKALVIAGVSQIVVSALFPVIGRSYESILLLRFLQGAAGGIAANTTMAYTPLWFPKKERGLASGILMGVLGLGFSISTFFAPRLSAAGMNWQMSLAVLVAVPGIITLLLLLFAGRDISDMYDGVQSIDDLLEAEDVEQSGMPYTSTRDRELPGSLKEAQKKMTFWLFCLSAFIISWAVYGFSAFLPSLIADDMGVSATTTTNIMSMTFFVAFVASPLGGIISDRIFKGSRWQTVFIGALMVIVALVLTPYSGTSPILLTLCLMCAYAGVNMTMGPFWAIPSAMVRAEAVADVVGFSTPVANIGGVAVAPVMAATIAMTGKSFMSLYITVVLAVILAVSMRIIRS